MSDIVFIKTWVDVRVADHYRIVDNMLMKLDQQWFGMKTVGQLRYEKGLKVEVKKDSLYQKIERPDKPNFRKLVVPTKITAALPYKNMPKNVKEGPKILTAHQKLLQNSLLKEVNLNIKRQRAIISSANMISSQQKKKRKEDKMMKDRKRKKEMEKMEANKAHKQKQKKLGF